LGAVQVDVSEELEELLRQFDAMWPDAVNTDQELRRSMGHAMDRRSEYTRNVASWLEEMERIDNATERES
jgi:hypothetical protein